jgi:2'-5' RNA ligase
MGTRAFLALDFDDAFLDHVLTLGRDLAPSPPLSRARWVARTAMHLTLRFFGDLEAELVNSVCGIVPKVARERAVIDVVGHALLAFPVASRARVLALDLDAPSIVELAAEADRALKDLGIASESRPFRPHLTLARLREPADLRRLLATRRLSIPGRVTSISFYESTLGPRGPTYKALARTALVS